MFLLTINMLKFTRLFTIKGVIFATMKYWNLKTVFTTTVFLAVLLAEAQGTYSFVEINPLHGHSVLSAVADSAKTYYGAGALTGFTELGGKLYFSAQGTPGDDELWVTDGTQAGTAEVKTINPGHGAGIANLVLLNNSIIFMASSNGASWDLWSTDGTGTGTKIIDTLNQPTNSALGYNNFSWIGNKVLFCTKEKLLITDGTASGTDSLLSISTYTQGFGYCDMAGQSYFILPEISGADEIWRSDGTTGGTQSVLSLDTTQFSITGLTAMQAFNGKLYLSAAENSQGADLFTFDGNLNGLLNRITIASSGYSNPHGFIVYNGSLCFIASNDTSANVYRVTTADSVPQPLVTNAAFATLGNLTIINNVAYFTGPDSTRVYSIELTGFTNHTLNLAGYHLPSYQYTDAPFLIGINQQIYFGAYDGATGNQVLMQSDFTSPGTHTIMPATANTSHPFNCRLNNGIHDVFDLKTWGSKLLVPANFDSAGRELWIFDPNGVNAVNEINGEERFSLSPNPASNQLIVKAGFSAGETPQLSIYDLTGQLVLRQALQNETTMVNTSLFSAGVYFVSVGSNGQPVSVKKLLLVK